MDNKTIRDRIEYMGGSSHVARALDIPITTVHSWLRRDRIPAWRRRDFERLEALANEL